MEGIEYYGATWPADDAWVRPTLRSAQYDFLQMQLRPKDRCVFIGGGLGILPLLAAVRVGRERVSVYEPDAALVALTQRHVKLDGEPLRVLQMAVTPHGGTTIFRPKTGPSYEVQTVDVNDATLGADVVVIDVKGGEHLLLDALRSPVPMLIVEFYPSHNSWLGMADHLGRHLRLKLRLYTTVEDRVVGFFETDARRAP